MRHKHHIIPKHMGGLDDPNNLIELTPYEHAEAHRQLYETHGKHEDYLAWNGLLGIATKQEIVKELTSLGGKRGGSKGGKSAVKTHKENKTGLFREDKAIQKLGNSIGAAAGGKAGSKRQIENSIGIFSYSKEEKIKIASLGGKASGSKKWNSFKGVK